MNGYDRIKEQYLALEEKDEAIKKIITYLIKRPNMNELYLKEEKKLEEMIQYIKKQAKKKAINNVAVIEDQQVYEWSVIYFTKSNEELEIESYIKTKPSTKTIKKDEVNKDQLKLEL